MFIYIIRHGITDWNISKKIQGPLDIPLNDIGKKQAQKLALRLKNKNIKIIFSSHLLRAYQTAKEISGVIRKPILINPLLREICHGDWNGKKHEEIELNYPSEHKIWKTSPHLISPPNGETLGAVRKRLLQFLEYNEIFSLNVDIAIVTHKICGAVLATILKNEDLSKTPYYYQNNAEFMEITI